MVDMPTDDQEGIQVTSNEKLRYVGKRKDGILKDKSALEKRAGSLLQENKTLPQDRLKTKVREILLAEYGDPIEATAIINQALAFQTPPVLHLIEKLTSVWPKENEPVSDEFIEVASNLHGEITIYEKEWQATGEPMPQSKRDLERLLGLAGLASQVGQNWTPAGMAPMLIGALQRRHEEQQKLQPVGKPKKTEGNDGKTIDEELKQLEKTAPPLDINSVKWVKNKRAAEIEGLEARTLSSYRNQGIKNADNSLGRDKDGRVWRRQGTPNSHPWYLRFTLRAK